MDYQSLQIKTVVELRKLAKDNGVKIPAGTNKSAMIDMLLQADAANAKKAAEKPAEKKQPEKPAVQEAKQPAEKAVGQRPEKPAVQEALKRRGRPAGRTVKAQAKPETKPEAKPENKPEAKAQPKPETKPENKPEAKAQPKPDTKPETKPEAKVQPKPETKPETKLEAKAQPKPETKPEVKPEAKAPEARQDAQRPVARRTPATLRANARPAAESAPRQAAPRYQSWNGSRPQGENRAQGEGRFQQRYAPGAQQRPVGYRINNRQEGQPRPAQAAPQPAAAPTAPAQQNAEAEQPARQEGYYNAEYKTANPAVPEMLAAGECGDGAGVLEIQADGYGFLRAENCLPGPNDVYISIAQIRRFGLRNGDHVVGKTRAQREGDRFCAMMYITEVNGETPEKAAERPRFEDLVPIYPDQRLRLEPPAGKGDLSLRLIDMLAPIGKGQRGMIVSQPKAGKTTLLKKVANAITDQYPDVHLIVLLIDERPEEVTDMQRSIKGEVIYSTFDEEPEHHTRVSEMVLARAQRLVETGKDVVVLMDSITRLARAYNLTITPTGRSLSGGLDPGALFRPKRFSGAARNIENGGSLTIIATALVETGSRMDDIIFEEFKGTGNMELHLDRKLSDRRVFPAIDLVKSGTRREELLLSEEEINGEIQVRRMLSGGKQQEMYESLIDLMSKTASNAEFFQKLKGWLAVYEKEGYSLGR